MFPLSPSPTSATPFVPGTISPTMVIPPTNLTRKHLFHTAKLAEEAKRYGHMVCFMKEIVQLTHTGKDISPKERCLLGAAFKNFVAQPREALRLATSTQSWHVFTTPVTSYYVDNCKAEIAEICMDIIELIDCRLYPSAPTKESKVHYFALKGDFRLYLAEIKGQMEGMLDEEVARSSFIYASQIAKDLDAMNPHRLALNLSVVLVQHLFKFYDAPLRADELLDPVLQIPAITESEKSPAVLFLTFEGGFQMLANLLTLDQKIVDQIRNRSAGPSDFPPVRAALHR